MPARVRVEPDQRTFTQVSRALRREADGRELRADLASTFHELLDDLVEEQRSGLMAMTTAGLQHEGESLRTAISDRIVVDVRMGGRSAGARIRVRKSGMPRRFVNAAKRLNAAQWRRQVFGRNVWITQISGAEGWFDDPIGRHGARAKEKAQRALGKVAQRIERTTT